MSILFFSAALLVVLGWVLRTNSADRKAFEKELAAELADDSQVYDGDSHF